MTQDHDTKPAPARMKINGIDFFVTALIEEKNAAVSLIPPSPVVVDPAFRNDILDRVEEFFADYLRAGGKLAVEMPGESQGRVTVLVQALNQGTAGIYQ